MLSGGRSTGLRVVAGSRRLLLTMPALPGLLGRGRVLLATP
ncbi:hypothetical protein [Nocardia goodfellowii]|uniref:Uncharacterized protein n=1 Tax=Nocardia goodfellowii TaxID=882446 RepID=A0ABS4QG53_9NOCA|nr:hypothetical protein [Nocardia goodfellowii]MBP2190662.1 hypothetical protein [Nocardia goodfellowii]